MKKEEQDVCIHVILYHYQDGVVEMDVLIKIFQYHHTVNLEMYTCSGGNCRFMPEASRMEWRIRDIKFLVISFQGLVQWRSRARIDTENERIHQLNACTFPLMQRCCMGAHTGPAGISSLHTVVNTDFTAQQRWWRAATGYCN